MAIITITKEHNACFDGENYTVDTNRKMEDFVSGSLICYIRPFFGIPLTLEIAICPGGNIAFRSWNWNNQRSNEYLHTDEKPDGYFPFAPTTEQIDTVNGLFSGRIKFEGLKLAVGATVQKICPVDVAREEELTGKKIYLA